MSSRTPRLTAPIKVMTRLRNAPHDAATAAVSRKPLMTLVLMLW